MDVAVVGAGITGVVAAYLLKRAGQRVALLELGSVGQGTTGLTTAKLTVGHGLVYRNLIASHGEATGRRYAELNQAAIAELEEIVRLHDGECDWEPASNYVYATTSNTVQDLEQEAEAAGRAGVEAVLTTETDLPFPVAAALRVDGQAQFHPLKFLHALAAELPGEGCHLFEQTKATGVRRGTTHVVETESGTVSASHVVIATQLPFLDRGLLFAKAHPKKSYAVAARIDGAQAPRGMYISADSPARSIRSTPADDGSRFVIVAGETATPGTGGDENRYARLEEFLGRQFGVAPEYRWSAHDYVPVDGLPYVGRLTRRDERILVATGFAKWGLTTGMWAARLIVTAILGSPVGTARSFDPHRRPGARGAAKAATENVQVARHFVGDRLKPRPGPGEAESLQPGRGAIVRESARQYAVHRDESGALHVLSARCPHLGCIVGWNAADRTWECPCHGSRFAADGSLLQGPATRDLERRALGRGASAGPVSPSPGRGRSSTPENVGPGGVPAGE